VTSSSVGCCATHIRPTNSDAAFTEFVAALLTVGGRHVGTKVTRTMLKAQNYEDVRPAPDLDKYLLLNRLPRGQRRLPNVQAECEHLVVTHQHYDVRETFVLKKRLGPVKEIVVKMAIVL